MLGSHSITFQKSVIYIKFVSQILILTSDSILSISQNTQLVPATKCNMPFNKGSANRLTCQA